MLSQTAALVRLAGMNDPQAIARSEDVVEGHITYRDTPRGPVVLTRIAGKVHALDARCPHLGFSLKNGTVEGGVIRCPWHGSRFDMRSGAVRGWVDAFYGKPMPRWTHRLIELGRKPRDATCVPVQERDGEIIL